MPGKKSYTDLLVENKQLRVEVKAQAGEIAMLKQKLAVKLPDPLAASGRPVKMSSDWLAGLAKPDREFWERKLGVKK